MELWDDYGIVSYNLGKQATYMAGSYHNMLLACKYKKPKLIVIDTFTIESESKIWTNRNFNHELLDAYPISYKKYLAIEDLFGREDLLNNEIEYLFNFSMYHARWSELTSVDFRGTRSRYEKGAESRIKITSPNKVSDIGSVDMYNGKETINMQYLRKMVDYCKQNDIEVLITYLPHPSTDGQIAASKYVQKICDEYSVNYLNFLDLDIVNYDIDCYDKDSHLNVSGARKITDYLGKYIIENYDIQDQRKNENYDFWYNDYNEYVGYKIKNLKANSENINNYLMLLYGEEDIGYEIKISSKQEITEGSLLQKLLKNLDNNYKIDDSSFVENKDKTVKITTYDNRTKEQIEVVWF